jgi:UDP-3-O-[3-hydroxymyristoyl] glucosamine N-acyltransferase
MSECADGASLEEIVARFGGKLVGDGSHRVVQVATLDQACEDQIAFLSNPKYRKQLATTRAGAVILPASAAPDCPCPCIVSDNPYAYFARVADLLNPASRHDSGTHPSAVVVPDLPTTVHVGALAFIDAEASVGADSEIGPGCVIGRGVRIGAGALLHSNVTVYPGCVIGRQAIIHSGAVIGADGFGMAREGDGSWTKIPQIGRVVIGDNVEIGANTTIDRGALGDTVIEDGVKLDNQIQIGHNVRIGAHTAMAGCVGVAGSARIGRRCTVGGGAIILGHLDIADDVNISAATLVTKSIVEPGTYTGAMPFEPHREWARNAARLRHLEDMADRIRELEARLARLEKKS